MAEIVNHPQHYGGDNIYEAIKVIEAWGLGFCLGNAVKYICRCDHKGTPVQDLEKAVWYLNHELENRREAANRLKRKNHKRTKTSRSSRLQATTSRRRSRKHHSNGR